MRAPDCSQHINSIRRIEELLSSPSAASDVRDYLASYRGARFDTTANHGAVNEFTDADFQAVGNLSVSVLHTARAWLTGDGHDQVAELLADVRADIDIWNVPPDRYETTLGPSSPAWRLWEIIAERQQGAGHAGRWVTASKLLAGKRPRLIPIFDQQEIRDKLGIEHREFWEVMWCVLQNPANRQRLFNIQAQVEDAQSPSALRVLDIVLWKAKPTQAEGANDASDHLESVRLAARRFRMALEQGGLRLSSLGNFPRDSCGDVSELLGQYLSDSGLGRWSYRDGVEHDSFASHAWVEQCGVIVDITADQFPDVSERVLVTTDRSWHDGQFQSSPGSKPASLEWFDGHDHRIDAYADYATLKLRADSPQQTRSDPAT